MRSKADINTGLNYRSRASFRFPQCVSLRSGLNTRSAFRFNARRTPTRACKSGPRSFSPTYDNEPKKQDRAYLADNPQSGGADYVRLPTGKFGEEMIGYAHCPLLRFPLV